MRSRHGTTATLDLDDTPPRHSEDDAMPIRVDLYLSFEPAKRIESFYYNAVSTSNQIFSLFTRIDVSSSQVISITILGHVDSQQHQSLFRGFLHSVAIKNNKYSGYHEFHDTHGILRKIR